MNNLLQLKGTFEQINKKPGSGARNISSNATVEISKLIYLQKDLIRLKQEWIGQDLINGALISVYYNKVVAKSNRIQGLLKHRGLTSNSSIVGARFSAGSSPKHIITHYVSINTITKSITKLEHCINILANIFNGEITHKQINELYSSNNFDRTNIGKTDFLHIIVDSYFVEKFDTLRDDISFQNDAIITIYDTNQDTKSLLEKIGIDIISNRIMDNTTILLNPNELALLKLKAPFLISMAVNDLSELTKDNFEFSSNEKISIPPPRNEPVIGVIDTLFDESVYFSEWVEYTNMISKDIPISQDDYKHGTAISSIIVDGASSNPNLDDGCGRFRVRHFGVATGKQFSSFSIIRNINEIIATNKDIKVWNLSLGSKLEINPNFISPEAAILDKIQFENDVIFVIAGTNKMSSEVERIGSPADSINSLVVNSVGKNNKPTEYSRKGPVLSFFTKPDISYYGGDKTLPIRVCTPTGEQFVMGTSFSAPWISRKLSYLIDILGLSREVAKALIINSSTGWQKEETSYYIGHGIVPIKIDDIVKSDDDEIQFVLSGKSEKYDTYNYNIPIPIVSEKHPFVSKITLCYFPACSRNQGVDYTNTELDISFGRLATKKNKKTNREYISIKTIDDNYQSSESEYYTFEENARKWFRKWDNIKHIREVITGRNKSKKSYENGLWGISIKTKERLEKKYGDNLKFGIVVTIKEIEGVNRIDEFIQNCQLRGWLVNKIDVQTRIDIFNTLEEDIELDDL